MKIKSFLTIGSLFAITIAHAQTEEVSRLTIGAGLGYNYLFSNVYDYSLTTDGNYNLKVEEASRENLVISNVLVFRFRRFKTKDGENIFYKLKSDTEKDDLARFNLMLSVNLLNLKSDNIGFNDKIDGGIGIGYSITPELQIGLFYEIKSYRQLRGYIIDNYIDKPIPKSATESYNSLDKSDNNLFRDKTLNEFQ